MVSVLVTSGDKKPGATWVGGMLQEYGMGIENTQNTRTWGHSRPNNTDRRQRESGKRHRQKWDRKVYIELMRAGEKHAEGHVAGVKEQRE